MEGRKVLAMDLETEQAITRLSEVLINTESALRQLTKTMEGVVDCIDGLDTRLCEVERNIKPRN